VGSVRYKVNNENGKISVEPGVTITQNNINDEKNINNKKNMVSNTGIHYKEPVKKGSERLLTLLKNLVNRLLH
jgi:hypothetical protein